jgi:hypothetical protein
MQRSSRSSTLNLRSCSSSDARASVGLGGDPRFSTWSDSLAAIAESAARMGIRRVLPRFWRAFGDHRDWPVIDAWAEQIALTLHGPRSATPR